MGKFDPNEATAALGSVIRMNYHLDNAQLASSQINPHEWFFHLRGFYREIYPKLTNDEVKKADSYIESLKPQIREWDQSYNDGESEVDDDFYEELDRLHKTLVKYADDHDLMLQNREVMLRLMDTVKGTGE